MKNKNYTDITHLVKKATKDKEAIKLIKTLSRSSLLIVMLITFSFLFNFYLNQNFVNQDANNRDLLLQKTQMLGEVDPVLPVRLIIPRIDVSADIKYVGVTTEGAMDMPNNLADVGWFKLGPRPGEKGSAVISGHVDGKDSEMGVFADLYRLKKGDKLYIENGKGVAIFVVRESRVYDPGYADDVFKKSDNTHLNLVTCDGVWDGDKKSYSKRLVVFADVID